MTKFCSLFHYKTNLYPVDFETTFLEITNAGSGIIEKIAIIQI